MTADPPKLSCQNLWKVYGPRANGFFAQKQNPVDRLAAIRADDHIPAVANVSFDVPAGEIFVIMGLSGSGKSTVIRCLSRLVEPESGTILLDGEDLLQKSKDEMIDIRRHRVGMVFQHFGLLPHQTVLGNVAFPLKVQGMKPDERHERARKMIELVGLAGREESFPRELSGGQQQRVGIARSLSGDPELWLLDEPFSALDPLIRRQMQDEFLRLQKMLNKTIVFITHDFLEALRLADRIAIMKDGEIVQIGTPAELVSNPADDYVAEFTRDVPRIKILTAREVLKQKLASASSSDTDNSGPSVLATATLDQILPTLASSGGSLTVDAADGQTLGSISVSDVLKTLAKESAS
ncbi:MAG: quaternary amine ABC transporter ATP-binding protein [Luminiphilus sp.]